MKKSLFAIAAVTAFAGAAQAQSSVTVYGIIDVGYVGGNERLASGNTATAFGTNQVVKQTTNGFGQSAQTTSRIGFRGREDLGGGTAASFTLEQEVTPNSANAFTSISNGTRLAFVGLSQKGYGQAALGLQNTLVTDAMTPTIAGQMNNIVGSLMFPGAIQGRTGPASNNGTNNFLQQNSTNGNTNAFTFRTSNTLKLQSERMAGLQVSAMYMLNDENDTQSTVRTSNATSTTTTVLGGVNNQNGWGLGANYQYKKFLLTAAYQSFRANNPYAVTTTSAGVQTTSPTAAFGQVNTGSNVNDNQAYVGAMYDFGVLKAYAGWVNRKVTSTVVGTQYASRSAQEIGVRGNWTPKIESWASIGNGSVKTFGASGPSAGINGWQLGSNYILSKRTNLYAIYGQNSTSNVSVSSTSNAQSYSSNNYAVGVRHTF
jgi:predicted porin